MNTYASVNTRGGSARRKITDPISKAYDYVDSSVEAIKCAFVGLCTDIDRYFELCFSLDLTAPAGDEQFEKVKVKYPVISDMTLDQFHICQKLFCEIRNINAHLFLNRPVFFDKQLETYLIRKAQPLFSISENGEITLYGAFYFLTFLSHKSAIWPFVVGVFRSDLLYDVNDKEISQLQIKIQHDHQSFCGKGKPVFPACYSMPSKIDIMSLNDTLKRGLTGIFFSFEKCILQWHYSAKKEPSFSYLLKEESHFENHRLIINEIIKMRNCWFHGKMFFDSVCYRGKQFDFNLDYVLNTLSEIKRILGVPKFDRVKNDIAMLGKAFADYYLLRLIEVSYKLLDNRLLTAGKTESRISAANNALPRILSQGKKYYESLEELIGAEIPSYYVKAPKFTDLLPRTTLAKPLIFHRFKSQNGYKIGEFQTNSTILSLAEVDLDYTYMNPINGVCLSQYKAEYEEYYSGLFKVVYHTL